MKEGIVGGGGRRGELKRDEVEGKAEREHQRKERGNFFLLSCT
jgi:hypothetical protein